MKIISLSDLHGTLLPVVDYFEPCELILICGDISPLNIQANDRKMKKWLENDFKCWCESLPCNKVLFIAGNHDWICSRNVDFMYKTFPKDAKVTYLFHEGYIHTSLSGEEIHIFGTPYCTQFGNWAFMEDDQRLTELFKKIDYNLDILITHDAPYGASDILLQEDVPWYTGKHIGSKPLAEAILLKQPKYVFHGHLHSTSRIFEDLGPSKVINCSIKDEKYLPIYDPIITDI